MFKVCRKRFVTTINVHNYAMISTIIFAISALNSCVSSGTGTVVMGSGSHVTGRRACASSGPGRL